MGRKLKTQEYADYRKKNGLPGATRQSVYNAIHKGWIRRTRGGFIDVDEADKSWASKSRSRSDGQSAGSADISAGDLDYHRARKEKALADLKELEEAQLAGRLVDKQEAMDRWFTVARATRDRIMGVADRLAGQLAAENSEHACRVMLDRELRDALREISGDL